MSTIKDTKEDILDRERNEQRNENPLPAAEFKANDDGSITIGDETFSSEEIERSHLRSIMEMSERLAIGATLGPALTHYVEHIKALKLKGLIR